MSFEEKLYALAVERVRRAEPMSRHTTFRIGGPAEFYVTPSDAEELCRVAKLCRSEAVPYYVIGNGSNLLCSDQGVSGVILDTTEGLVSCRADGTKLWAGAGMLLGCLAKKALEAGLSGLEFAAGIPGSVGGAMVMNDGFYYASMGLTLKTIPINSVSGALMGGEGLFNLSVQGNGICLLESPCPREELVTVELDNDVLKIDGNYAVCWSPSLSFTVERTTKTLVGSAASGEGLVNVYRGTGRVMMALV